MPELPEVEVVRRGLLSHVLGRRIETTEVLDDRTARRQAGGPAALAAGLEGARIAAVVRRGKFLWWRLEDPAGEDPGHALMTHLGMSGQLRIRSPHRAGAHTSGAPSEGPAADPLRHRRASFRLDDGTVVDFLDQRLFGGVWTSPLVASADGLLAGEGSPDALLPRDVAHVSRDLLDPAVDLPSIARRLRTRRAPVKSLLLAQDIVSGIGNIYADEALWAARAHHDTAGEDLSQVRAHRLLRECAAVMTRALAVGGTSFDALYVNVDGRSGYFARSLAAYGREGHPCPRCGTAIRRVQRQGRSCYWCPRCQRRRTSRPSRSTL
ncbi:MAG: bifunctional DNA-formamidopyrimidine glycosylase/DNA-(apurinic or apyrimidinic site) lyase [Brachybacterium sp.]|nr:bifunctional DNA-formamidopyrimidine glycosylase/DNA-(apurinic or apyrimidinic site) lyase [Brachybacterium sp.]